MGVDNNSTDAQTYEWDWGDGTAHEFIADPNPHSYSTPGITYTVTLTVTNPIGTSVRTRTVEVKSPPAPIPVAGFYGTPVAGQPRYTAGGGDTGTPITGEKNTVVQFTNVSTDGTAYEWDFGDGTRRIDGFGPSAYVHKAGRLYVTLTITAPTGGSPFTRASYVTTGCVVPNFAPHLTSEADAMWSGAGFTGDHLSIKRGRRPAKHNPPNPAEDHPVSDRRSLEVRSSLPRHRPGTQLGMRRRHHPDLRPVIRSPGRRRTRGQALVEFALVIPLFLLLIFGIVDAGRLIYAYNTVSNSARNSARVAIVNQSTTGSNTCDTMDPTVYAVGCAISSGIALGITAPDVSIEYRDATDTADCINPMTNPPVIPMGCVAVVEVTGHFQHSRPSSVS